MLIFGSKSKKSLQVSVFCAILEYKYNGKKGISHGTYKNRFLAGKMLC